MISAQNVKELVVFPPATLATNATASAQIDTLGFRWATIRALEPKASATNQTNIWQVFKLTEGDTTVYSNASAIVQFTGTTNTVTDATNGYCVPAAYTDTSAGRVGILMNVDLRKRKRYLFVTAEPGAANSTVAVTCQLTRAEEQPNTDTERNVGKSVVG